MFELKWIFCPQWDHRLRQVAAKRRKELNTILNIYLILKSK